MTKEEQARVRLQIRDLSYNIKEEESEIQNDLAPIYEKATSDFNKALLVKSKEQIYKTYSSIGLLKLMQDRGKIISYKVIDIANLLDVWYDKQTDILSKKDLTFCEVLIIKGRITSYSTSYYNKIRAIQDIIDVRQTHDLLTWIFIKDRNKSNELSKMIDEDLVDYCECLNVNY